MIYLSIQVRHAKNESANALHEARATGIRELHMGVATSDGLAGAMTKAMEATGSYVQPFNAALIEHGSRAHLPSVPMKGCTSYRYDDLVGWRAAYRLPVSHSRCFERGDVKAFQKTQQPLPVGRCRASLIQQRRYGCSAGKQFSPGLPVNLHCDTCLFTGGGHRHVMTNAESGG